MPVILALLRKLSAWALPGIINYVIPAIIGVGLLYGGLKAYGYKEFARGKTECENHQKEAQQKESDNLKAKYAKSSSRMPTDKRHAIKRMRALDKKHNPQ